MVITQAFYTYLLKFPEKEVSHWDPLERDAHHQGLLHISFRKPPLQVPLS
jgi:hypothetical protein